MLWGMCPQSDLLAGKGSEVSALHAAGLAEISRASAGCVTPEKLKQLNQERE